MHGAEAALAAFDAGRIAPTGFREYDARWRYPEEIDQTGLRALGLALGTQLRAHGLAEIVVCNDYRSYAPAVKDALMLGLIRAGITVHDIGTGLTPMAYFARHHLGIPAVAMVTASHNPNGWTGVKMGLAPPLTHGPEEMAELRDISLAGRDETRSGGGWRPVPGIREAWLDDVAGTIRLSRPLRVVVATGNGGAGAFAPALLARLGAEVIPLHTGLDATFPNYNPNPESMGMLRDMGRAVRAAGADLALGFDGDGDRCGVVDETGHEIFADKMGLILARDWAAAHPGAHLVVDVKSTGLFATDPVLSAAGITTEVWKTGHSHMKRRVAETGALAGFEKSGHYFLAPPLGRGHDCALTAAREICRLMDRHPGRTLSALAGDLPPSATSPTMSPACPDGEKYAVAARLSERLQQAARAGTRFAGRRIAEVITVNGARVVLEDGAFALLRPSSNTPNLVVVLESPRGAEDLQALLAEIDSLLASEPAVGPFDQRL